MSEKIFVADKATLDNVDKNVQRLADALISGEAAVYGMIVHEDDLNPATRVEYIGANKDFTPMSMDYGTHKMNYGDWADWGWLKANVPVMANFDGGIEYYLDPDDYTKKADKTTASDVGNESFSGDAMAVIKKIYKKEWKAGHDRYVLFSEEQLDPDFLPVGFDVGGKVRDYMLIPMFYGSIDSTGKMRSLSGAWSCLTASGSHADVDGTVAAALEESAGITTEIQYKALQNASKNSLFFGGPLVQTLSDICYMLTKGTNSQAKFGNGVCSTYNAEGSTKENHYSTLQNAVVPGGQFYGTNDSKSFCKIFHSAVLGSYMLWQRDPYVLLDKGRLKVSTDYTYSLTGEGYLDTGMDFDPADTNVHYYPYTNVVKGYGALPRFDAQDKATTALGYCDGIWANKADTRVSLRFGTSRNGLDCGLSARSLIYVAADAGWSYGASKLLPGPAAA